jgi:hypothetical protein
MEEGSEGIARSNGDEYPIIEVLCQADSLLTDKLRIESCKEYGPEVKYLLEAQLNISRAIEALYDRLLHKRVN